MILPISFQKQNGNDWNTICHPIEKHLNSFTVKKFSGIPLSFFLIQKKIDIFFCRDTYFSFHQVKQENSGKTFVCRRYILNSQSEGSALHCLFCMLIPFGTNHESNTLSCKSVTIAIAQNE